MSQIQNKRTSWILSVLLIYLTPVFARSAPVSVGDSIPTYSITDNHENPHQLGEDVEVLIMSFEMDNSKRIHKWLEEKETDYLEKNKIQYVADITKMPAIITKLFAGPKMAKYPFTILLANDDDFEAQFPKKVGKITTFVIDGNKKIKNILFLNSMDEVNGLVGQ